MRHIAHITYLKELSIFFFLSKYYVFATRMYRVTLVLQSDGPWLATVIHKRVLHIFHLCDTGMAFLSALLALLQI